MVSTVIKVTAAVLVLLLLTRCKPRELLLVSICVLTMNELFLPYYALPFRGTRQAALLALLGLALLYLLVIDIRGGEGLQYRLPRVVNTYWLGLLALIAILFGYMLITRDPSYGLLKVRNLVMYSLLPITVISLFTPFRSHELRLILIGLGLGAFLVAVQLALNPHDIGTLVIRKSVGDDVHPNNVARNIALGLPIIIAALVGARRLPFVHLVGLLSMLMLMSVVTTLTGSRGPLLAAACAVIAFLVFMLIYSRRRYIIVRFLGGIIFMTLMSGFIYNTFLKDQQTFSRILVYSTTVGANASDMSRVARYRVAWQGFVDSNLVGIGPGGFKALWQGSPPGDNVGLRDYPHNFLLEAMVEGGLGGALIVIIMVVGLVITILRRPGQLSQEDIPFAGLFVALWVYTFINSSVSGDIATNYQMWVSGAIVWLIFSRGVELEKFGDVSSMAESNLRLKEIEYTSHDS